MKCWLSTSGRCKKFVEDKFQIFITNSELKKGIDCYLPQRTVKVHQTDRPWMTSKLKIWIRKRQIKLHFKGMGKTRPNTNTGGTINPEGEIKSAKSYYYTHKVAELGKTKPRKWWKQIKSLIGQDIEQEWYYQFLGGNGDVKVIADKVNDFFLSITEDFPPLLPPYSIQYVPNEFFGSEADVYQSLSTLKISKSIGPDEIPSRVLKEFAPKLSSAIQDIYSQSMNDLLVARPPIFAL